MLKRKLISAVTVVLIIPAVIIGGLYLSHGRYYIPALAVVVLSAVPFALKMNFKKLQAREIAVMASITALCVASRAAFFAVPQFKPMCAILIICAASFGKEVGFICGAVSMLLSNMIFGQGIHTPFQMFGMALTAYICGALFHKTKLSGNFIAVCILGAAVCFIVYGFVVDTCSVLMMVSDFTLGSVVSVYLSGVAFNAVHAAATAVFLLIGYIPIKKKLDRIMIKYALFGEETL